MTGHKGDSEFCLPEVEGKQNSLFPEGPVFKCFVIPPENTVFLFYQRKQMSKIN